jgi:hypothetical protein
MIEITENKDNTIQLYADGSKSEHGVGPGVMIFVGNILAAQLKFRVHKKCSNNQEEQLAIVKVTHTHTHTHTHAHTHTHTHTHTIINIIIYNS